ncbi:MAG: Crp/Fnr family transcriptional regulator, partial [Sphingobacteriaceae bacterium]
MYPELLKHIKNHISITAEDEKLITDNFSFIKLKKRQFLLEPGKICKGNCFVVKGCMRMYFINNKLVEQITHFGLENWWVADYDSLVNQKPSVYYMQAIEDCELLLLTPQNQELLFKAIPQLETYFRLMFERAIIASQRRI